VRAAAGRRVVTGYGAGRGEGLSLGVLVVVSGRTLGVELRTWA